VPTIPERYPSWPRQTNSLISIGHPPCKPWCSPHTPHPIHPPSPLQAQAGLLWVWGDPASPPPPDARPAVTEELGREGWTLLGGDWFQRDLEYRFGGGIVWARRGLSVWGGGGVLRMDGWVSSSVGSGGKTSLWQGVSNPSWSASHWVPAPRRGVDGAAAPSGGPLRADAFLGRRRWRFSVSPALPTDG
jgi:hypothetical protein